MLFKYMTVTLLIICAASTAVYAADSEVLWLVNRDNRLSSTYHPYDLVTYQGIKLRQSAYDAFLSMQKALQTAGIHNLRLQSAYRSYEHQAAIFNQRVKELQAAGYIRTEAERKAALSIQPPGASEHQLGLALDVSVDGKLTQDFGETETGKWLAAHCHEFGFVIRYPQAKTNITQIIYEPWHLRYVGTPHAAIMKNLSLTLEEYAAYVKAAGAYVFWIDDNNYFLLSHTNTLPADESNSSSTSPQKNGYITTKQKVYPQI